MSDPAEPSASPSAPAPATPPEPAPAAPTSASPQAAPAAAAAPAPKPARKPSWLGVALSNALSLVVVLWISTIYLRLALQIRGASFVGLAAKPIWPFYGASALIALGCAVYALVERVRRRSSESPAFRLLPIVAVVFLAVHFLALPPCIPPYPANLMAASQLSLIEQAPLAAEDGLVPLEPKAFSSQLPELPPPYLRDGKPMAEWSPMIRADCDGPIAQLPTGAQTGTLLVCVSRDRHTAWVTAVGLSGAVAGDPALIAGRDGPLVVKISAERAGASNADEAPNTDIGADEPDDSLEELPAEE